jgi:hypothetical protein
MLDTLDIPVSLQFQSLFWKQHNRSGKFHHPDSPIENMDFVFKK